MSPQYSQGWFGWWAEHLSHPLGHFEGVNSVFVVHEQEFQGQTCCRIHFWFQTSSFHSYSFTGSGILAWIWALKLREMDPRLGACWSGPRDVVWERAGNWASIFKTLGGSFVTRSFFSPQLQFCPNFEDMSCSLVGWNGFLLCQATSC